MIVPQGGWRVKPVYRIAEVHGKGTVRGTVLRRIDRNHPFESVVGATVRFGCRATSTTMSPHPTIGFDFIDTKAGRYDLQAFQFVVDEKTMVAQEWKSEVREINLRDGDDRCGIVLKLIPPPGLARTLGILSHHDIVDRVVVSEDRWGHPDMSGKIQLAFDLLDDEDAPPKHQNMKLTNTWVQTTPEVGSGVHVRVSVTATLRQDPGVAPDGAIVCDVHIVFFDAGEGETNGTVDDLAITLKGGKSHKTPHNMVSDDTVPERASGTFTVTNLLAALP